jgi:hypothetical protein
MGKVAGILAVGMVMVLALDLASPSVIRLEHGSVGIDPQTADPRLLPFDPLWDDPECEEPGDGEDEPCARRYAFDPGATLTVWISVRNAGPVPIRLLGVSDTWLATFADVDLLAEPTATVDGGDPHQAGTLAMLTAEPFRPLILGPGDERLIGVEFAFTTDLEHACRTWQQGGAVGWERVPVSWSGIVLEHEDEVAFADPVSFMAPTAEDCR